MAIVVVTNGGEVARAAAGVEVLDSFTDLGGPHAVALHIEDTSISEEKTKQVSKLFESRPFEMSAKDFGWVDEATFTWFVCRHRSLILEELDLPGGVSVSPSSGVSHKVRYGGTKPIPPKL